VRFISGGNATSGLRAREAGLSLIVSAPIQCAVRIASSRGTAHEWPRRQGALIATPQLRLLSTLTCAIASGDKQFRPALVISKDVRGSIEWKAADGQPIRLTVSWVQ
jgi:hypothetical protein